MGDHAAAVVFFGEMLWLLKQRTTLSCELSEIVRMSSGKKAESGERKPLHPDSILRSSLSFPSKVNTK